MPFYDVRRKSFVDVIFTSFVCVPSAFRNMASVVPAKWLESFASGGIEDTRFLVYMNRCLIIPRVLGIYSLRHKSGSSFPCPYFLAYNIVLMLFIVQVVVFSNFYSLTKYEFSPVLYLYLNSVILSVSFFLFSYRVVKDYKIITRVFQCLEISEKRLSALGAFFSYGKFPLFFCCLMLTSWICQTAIFKTFYDILQIFPLIADLLKLLYIFSPFCFVALLHAIEVQLRNGTRHLFWIANCNMVRKKKIEFLEILVEINEELFTTSCDIGKLYSSQLLYTVCSAFTIFLFNTYRCVIEELNKWIIIGYFLEALNGFLLICMICSSTEKVRKQVSVLYLTLGSLFLFTFTYYI